MDNVSRWHEMAWCLRSSSCTALAPPLSFLRLVGRSHLAQSLSKHRESTVVHTRPAPKTSFLPAGKSGAYWTTEKPARLRRRVPHLLSVFFQVRRGPNSYWPLETTNRLLTGGMAPSARCFILLMKTFRGSALMEGNEQVPDTCRTYRRPVPTASKVKGRSKTPALELENLTAKRTESPARI